MFADQWLQNSLQFQRGRVFYRHDLGDDHVLIGNTSRGNTYFNCDTGLFRFRKRNNLEGCAGFDQRKTFGHQNTFKYVGYDFGFNLIETDNIYLTLQFIVRNNDRPRYVT